MNDIQRNKDRALELLTQAYVKGAVTTEDFEASAGRIEHADSAAAINRELELYRGQADILDREIEPAEGERIVCHGSRKVVNHRMLRARRLEIDIAHSSVLLDYSSMDLPPGVYEIEIKAIHSSCRIIVPSNVEIENRTQETYSSFKDKTAGGDGGGKSVLLRISGELLHSSLKAVGPRRRLFGFGRSALS